MVAFDCNRFGISVVLFICARPELDINTHDFKSVICMLKGALIGTKGAERPFIHHHKHADNQLNDI